MKAYPIDKDGDKCGAIKDFSAEHWDCLNRTFGKNLRWKKYERTRRRETVVPVKQNDRTSD